MPWKSHRDASPFKAGPRNKSDLMSHFQTTPYGAMSEKNKYPKVGPKVQY